MYKCTKWIFYNKKAFQLKANRQLSNKLRGCRVAVWTSLKGGHNMDGGLQLNKLEQIQVVVTWGLLLLCGQRDMTKNITFPHFVVGRDKYCTLNWDVFDRLGRCTHNTKIKFACLFVRYKMTGKTAFHYTGKSLHLFRKHSWGYRPTPHDSTPLCCPRAPTLGMKMGSDDNPKKWQAATGFQRSFEPNVTSRC